MFGIGAVELLVMVLVFVAMAVAVAVALLRSTRHIDDLDPAIARARRRQGAVAALSGAAALTAIPAGFALAGTLQTTVVLSVLPSLMVAVACAVLWLGELTFERPSGAVRTTVLNDRAITSVVPRAWVLACVVLGVLVLVGFAVSLAAGHLAAIPQSLALTGAGVLAWLVCRSTTTRPTIASDLHADAVLRRTSGGRVLRWLAWGLTATAAGDLIVGGVDLQSSTTGIGAAVGVSATVLGWPLMLATILLPFAPVPQLPHTYPAPRSDDVRAEAR